MTRRVVAILGFAAMLAALATGIAAVAADDDLPADPLIEIMPPEYTPPVPLLVTPPPTEEVEAGEDLDAMGGDVTTLDMGVQRPVGVLSGPGKWYIWQNTYCVRYDSAGTYCRGYSNGWSRTDGTCIDDVRTGVDHQYKGSNVGWTNLNRWGNSFASGSCHWDSGTAQSGVGTFKKCTWHRPDALHRFKYNGVWYDYVRRTPERKICSPDE